MKMLSNPNNPRRIAYVADGNLQLQRMAFIGAGYVNWENEEEEIPYTMETCLPCPTRVGNCVGYPRRDQIIEGRANGNNDALMEPLPDRPHDMNMRIDGDVDQRARPALERISDEDFPDERNDDVFWFGFLFKDIALHRSREEITLSLEDSFKLLD